MRPELADDGEIDVLGGGAGRDGEGRLRLLRALREVDVWNEGFAEKVGEGESVVMILRVRGFRPTNRPLEI